MRSNRVLDTFLAWRNPLLIVFLIVIGVAWLFHRKDEAAPQDVGSIYEQGLQAYRENDFRRAVEVLGRAYAVDADNVGVNTLLGWSHWRLENVPQARFHFERALAGDRSSVDAQTGLGLTSLAQNDLDTAVPLLERVWQANPADRDVASSLAVAYVRHGWNTKAAAVYRAMLARDPGDALARREFLGLFGYPEYRDDLPARVEPRARPPSLEQWFRARGDVLQAFDGTAWRDVYLVGSNLGPARPGEFPSTVSREYSVYEQWLREMSAMNANVVRVYTILPPAFYRALDAHNRRVAVPLWLIQEVWIDDAAQDLYDPRIVEEFETDLEHVIDLLHGVADVPFRAGAQYGIYTADVSRWVIGLAIGREVEPQLVQRTNARHAGKSPYAGRHVSLPRGNATEAWFARMCDHAVEYETAKYNAQRPLTIVNWPPLDSLSHRTESSFAEEVAVRQARGEPVSLDEFALPDYTNDTDVVSVDVTRFQVGPTFTAGLFALYHVYQHWPDFIFHEPSFARARDALGPNRYLGYLQELKQAHRGLPLVIGEYGLATSFGIAHLHPDGWHNGGLSEADQASLLSRFTMNHREVGAAGSVVFAWKDEWWKRVADRFTSDYEIPRDRDPLWFNVLDPEEAFGIIGYEPDFPVPLLRARMGDWERAQTLAQSQQAGDGPRAVAAMVDYAYLYLRLDLPPGSIDWQKRHYWIALNTLPGESGSRTLPGATPRMESGANFILQLAGPGGSQLLIAENYSPNRHAPIAGVPGETRIERKVGFTVELSEAAAFSEILIEPNERRFGRDGTYFPGQKYSRSVLPFGTADRASGNFTGHALWHADATTGMIELRIPWGLLYVTDPSSRQVFAGLNERGVPSARGTRGISVAVMTLAVEGAERDRLLASLPALENGAFKTAPPIYSWKTWNEVQVRPYFKKSYRTLTPLFAQWQEPMASAPR